MYEDAKKYGPYKGKDGRLRLVLIFKNKRTTISYPKYLMEVHLGRYLKEDETVDHIDGNPLNNNLLNLQVIPRSLHVSLDVKRIEDQTYICVWCNNSFVIEGSKVRNRRRNKAGPFCSRSCSGKYGAALQNRKIEKLPSSNLDSKYFTIKSQQSLQSEMIEVDNPNSGKP